MNKPYSESCDENKQPILGVLEKIFTRPGVVLEIGSGTGQHAVYFSERLPHVTWQPTDVDSNLPGIRAWINESPRDNLREPLSLNVHTGQWPDHDFHYVYSANTAHIMSWTEVEHMFQGVGRNLLPGGRFALYGPFNYQGRYTSESNERFDQWLKNRDPASGLRDFAEVNELAQQSGMELLDDFAMPLNNRTLVWQKPFI
jgi:cyclopropane fatty-acyl-phospholipid synthase-like methyltransferase